MHVLRCVRAVWAVWQSAAEDWGSVCSSKFLYCAPGPFAMQDAAHMILLATAECWFNLDNRAFCNFWFNQLQSGSISCKTQPHTNPVHAVHTCRMRRPRARFPRRMLHSTHARVAWCDAVPSRTPVEHFRPVPYMTHHPNSTTIAVIANDSLVAYCRTANHCSDT